MTKEDCLRRIKEFKNPVWETIMQRAKKILDSGFVNADNFESGYLLPKLIMEVCLRYVAKQYHPSNLTKEEKDTIRNFYDL